MSAGFTLLDVLMTVLIIGIVATAAGPRFSNALHKMRAESAAKRVKADLGWVRQNAIASSVTRTIQFTPGSNSYSVAGLPNLNNSSQPYVVSLSEYPCTAVLYSASFGGGGSLQFDWFGKPSSGGTITIKAGSFQQTVTVNAESGKASIP